MKKLFLLITLLAVILLLSFFYYKHRQNEMAAFNYAKEFVVTEFNESNNLSHGGTRYDFGRGNYFVTVQNQQEKKYYLEVKLDNDKGLVSYRRQHRRRNRFWTIDLKKLSYIQALEPTTRLHKAEHGGLFI